MSSEKLSLAISAIKSGDKATGSHILNELLKNEPSNELAWIWLATCVDEKDKKIDCLKKALSINPNNQIVIKAISKLEQPPLPTIEDIVPILLKETPLPSEKPIALVGRPTINSPEAKPVFNSNQTPLPTAVSVNRSHQASQSHTAQQSKTPKNANRIEKILAISLAILFVLFIIIFLIRKVGINWGTSDNTTGVVSNGITTEFKSNLNTFLVEAEKLNVMTQQGVSNQNFRNQLAEVKSNYMILDGSWPISLTAEKQEFDKAIEGWDLTLQMWDYGLENSPTSYGIAIPPESLWKRASEYTDVSTEFNMYVSVKFWLPYIIETASKYYSTARDSINNIVK